MCPNKQSCPPQVAGRLKTWVNELNILGWGVTLLDKLAEEKLATDIDGLYQLTEDQLANVDRLGKKSAQNLLASLEKHKEVKLENLIGGLGIEGIATSTTRLIIEKGHDTIDKLFKLTELQLENIAGFGEVRSKAFISGLKENKTRIENILKHVTIKAKITGGLSGKSFAITGTLSTPRKQIQTLIEENGGIMKKSVGKGLSYLIIDDPNSNSSKAQAAKKLGTNLISEKEFLDMIDA